jgi:outer membrane receptor for monomeric catechols
MTKVRTDKYMMEKKRQARNKQFWINVQELEDTKWVIRIRTSKKNRQHSGQKKRCKKKNNDLKNIHIKLKIE